MLGVIHEALVDERLRCSASFFSAYRGCAMHRARVLFKLITIVTSAMALCARGEPAMSHDASGIQFAHPDRIRYDRRSLIIDGKPVFVFSGAMHYFRCPAALWKIRLQQLKDAGLNCVETYLAWNLHEPDEPENADDFSKLRDLEQISDFIQTARDLGLYVIIRPGPYICAEWDRGGLPGWLMKHRPEGVRWGHYLRGNSPGMLAWDRHWITAAARVVKPHLITNVPLGSTGVILWQIENEYDWNGAGLGSDVRTDVLRALARASLDSGIDVPLFTCETMDKAFRQDPLLRLRVFNTTNKYPNYDMEPLIESIEKVAEYQPETFRGITELQGGWFSQVGGGLSGGHNAAQITQLTLTAIERGCTMINYYMFYGGSNFGHGAARGLTQTYDYNAPLREWGGTEDRYFAVKAIGQMLKEHGQRLIDSNPVELTVEGDHKDVSIYLRRSDDGTQYYFVRNSREHESRPGTMKVRQKGGPLQILRYDLGKFEAKVLYVAPGTRDLADGEWLPKPVARTSNTQPAPTAVPATVPVQIVSISNEEPADGWREMPTGKHLVSADIFDQRYVHYRVNFNLNASDLQSSLALFIRSDGGGESLRVRVNGTELLASVDGLILLDGFVRQGSNTAEILFENLGCPNFGSAVESEQGIIRISLVPDAVRHQALDAWRMKLLAGKAAAGDLPEVRTDFDDREWQVVCLTDPAAKTPAGMSAVYRAALTMTNDRLSAGVALSFPVIDDSGTLFVNGQHAGSANEWSHPWTFDITQHLHEGDNSIAIVVQNDWGDGGPLRGCQIDPVGRLLDNVTVSPATRLADESIGPDQHRSFLVHYTLAFQMPRTSEAMSVPWKLHLQADANAFVTLNGRVLGRYWAAGPQRDIWLPECWLNFGPDAKNVIELQARPTVDEPVGKIIKLAEVRSYVQADSSGVAR
jgi:hypothetical protein